MAIKGTLNTISDYKVRAVVIRAAAIATTGSPADKGNVALPAEVTRYLPIRVIARATAASSSMATAEIDIFTAAAGGGSSILNAAVALSGLTGTANQIQSLTLATFTAATTAATLYLRQTVDSGNAGTIDVVIEYLDLT